MPDVLHKNYINSVFTVKFVHVNMVVCWNGETADSCCRISGFAGDDVRVGGHCPHVPFVGRLTVNPQLHGWFAGTGHGLGTAGCATAVR